jgi:long-chain acyl-CoA synthetase
MTRETLPRTLLGKYQRHKLAPIYERAARGEQAADDAADPGDDDLLADSTASAVLGWLRARFPDKPVRPGTSPQLDLGVDSLGWVQLTAEIDERFGVTLSETAIARCLTVRDLLREVTQAPRSDPASAKTAEPLPRWLRDGQTAGERIGAAVLHTLVRAVARTLFRLRVAGVDTLPAQGPAIIAPNHLSDLDVIILAAALPGPYRTRIAWGAERTRLFSSRAGRLLARLANLFPVDERTPRASIATAIQVLEQGRILIWFPEEFRSPDGSLQPFKAGIGQVVQDTGAPVVPTAITGTYAAMPRGRSWPRPAATAVTFGETVTAETLRADAAAPATIAERIRTRVAELLGDGR